MSVVGILARAEAVIHKIIHPAHKITWRYGMTDDCEGDIVCETCQIVYVCRMLEKRAKRRQGKE